MTTNTKPNPLSLKLQIALEGTDESQAFVTVPRRLLVQIAAELKLRDMVEVNRDVVEPTNQPAPQVECV